MKNFILTFHWEIMADHCWMGHYPDDSGAWEWRFEGSSWEEIKAKMIERGFSNCIVRGLDKKAAAGWPKWPNDMFRTWEKWVDPRDGETGRESHMISDIRFDTRDHLPSWLPRYQTV